MNAEINGRGRGRGGIEKQKGQIKNNHSDTKIIIGEEKQEQIKQKL